MLHCWKKKRNPPLNRGIRSCEGLLLRHNVRYENNERYVDYERYKHKNNYKNYAFFGVSLVYNIRNGEANYGGGNYDAESFSN